MLLLIAFCTAERAVYVPKCLFLLYPIYQLVIKNSVLVFFIKNDKNDKNDKKISIE